MRRRVEPLRAVVAVALLAAPGLAAGQEHDPGILQAVTAAYAGISANEGEARDWQGFQELFVPGAQLIQVRGNAEEGFVPQTMTVAEWTVANMGWLEGRGFVEDAVHHRVESYGPVAHVFTSWVTRQERGGEERSRGAATLQLVQTPEGWRVANWIWTGEVDGVPLPRGG